VAKQSQAHVRFNEAAGRRLRRLRRLAGMTQQQLADVVGTRFQQVQKYECGANGMSLARASELAAALGVSVAVLAGEGGHSEAVLDAPAGLLELAPAWAVLPPHVRAHFTALINLQAGSTPCASAHGGALPALRSDGRG